MHDDAIEKSGRRPSELPKTAAEMAPSGGLFDPSGELTAMAEGLERYLTDAGIPQEQRLLLCQSFIRALQTAQNIVHHGTGVLRNDATIAGIARDITLQFAAPEQLRMAGIADDRMREDVTEFYRLGGHLAAEAAWLHVAPDTDMRQETHVERAEGERDFGDILGEASLEDAPPDA